MDVDHHGTPAPSPSTTSTSGNSADGDSGGGGRPLSAGAGTADDVGALAVRLADLARDLQAAADPQEVLDRAAATAVDLVPGAAHASISLVRARRQVTSAAVTGPPARRLDELQDELGQGPCLDAAFEHRSTRVDDLATDPRWPALAARAGEVGMPSVLCLQLYVDGDGLGALKLLGTDPAAFSDTSEHIGLLLAAHTAVAVADAQRAENLHRGLTHRDVIGQAKGILMERHKLSPDQAFAVLSQLSQDLNRKLYDLAADLATSGELPRRPAPRPDADRPAHSRLASGGRESDGPRARPPRRP